MQKSSSFIAVNWGSTNFRAHLVDETGAVRDKRESPSGILKLDRQDIIDTLEVATRDWEQNLPIYLNGMIGSTVGWEDVPYVQAPCSLDDFCDAIFKTKIGTKNCGIIPGISCRNNDQKPDIMRGEEIEIFGTLGLMPQLSQGEHVIVLPGTHSKWVKIRDGRVIEFFTSMVGEVFDHLSNQGLLSSVMDGYGEANSALKDGVVQGLRGGTGLGRLLFGVRAQVVCGDLDKSLAASYARGIFLGSEIGDAIAQYPDLNAQDGLLVIGAPKVTNLYAAALKQVGLQAKQVDAGQVTMTGYRQLHENIAEPVC